MYLSPLNIYYTSVENQPEDFVTEIDLEKMTKSYKEKRQCPKLQVFYKNKHYFTLNNAELRVCRRLQNDGFCHMIRVERVPVKRIPKGILEMMVVPEKQSTANKDVRKSSQTVYKKIPRDTMENNNTDSTKQTAYNVSVCSQDEGSQDDWQDDTDSDKWVSSSDESTESEVEEEEETLI